MVSFQCQDSKGIFEDATFPFLQLQIGIAILLTGIFNVLLGHLDQIKYVSSAFAGIAVGIIGPFLGSTKYFQAIAENSEWLGLVELISFITLTCFSFLVGVKTDMNMVVNARKTTYIIGFSTFIFPLLVNAVLSVVIMKTITMENELSDSLKFISLAVSTTSFYDTACAVNDMNLLNSEIGRLALAISIITGLFSWGFAFGLTLIAEFMAMKRKLLIISVISKFALLIFVLFIVRPVVSWMNRKTPEGKTLREGYVSVIISTVLGVAFYSEFVGQHGMFGPLMLGLVVPVGTPVGIAVQKKLDCFVTYVLMPTIYIVAGYKVQKFESKLRNWVIVEFMIFFACFSKIIAVMLSSLYCQFPIQDSFLLGLILNCAGIFYLIFCISMDREKFIDQPTYTYMLLTSILITMVSSRYTSYKRQTIQNSSVKEELRILACVYNQENVPSILNFLEATNPTKDSTVCIYILHLVELIGRAASVLVRHKQKKKKITRSQSRNTSEKIINAFNHFAEQNPGFSIGQAYTAVSPIEGMHNDVCHVAMETRTHLLVIPFGELAEHPFRAINQSVLHEAPCSVGILVDHIDGVKPVVDASISSCHSVAMIFIGGPDDREALAYGMRMADDNPNLKLSVFRFTHTKLRDDKNTKKDDELINELWQTIENTVNIEYIEEALTDCADTASRIKSLEETYDFILVGRRHEDDSPILHGLDEWCVYKELGVVGDLFATSSFQGGFSLLVMQQ
ncbi:cation/H(+) antiporter 15-like [Papaver somniferum]|uniref:cation/H(+) antiporter 15-like n=1 Tax=Papaver somniferum TaxID=3469 RepID=UPI000E6F4D2C|nr:cation/H(+) antiporter 15-like [Papaver somniferum]